MSRSVYVNSVLREQWDYTTRLYTTWDAAGVQSSQRVFTAAENTRADADQAGVVLDTNRSDLTTKALSALAANDTYRAIVGPTNAQVVTQVDRLTRECSGMIRLLLAQLDTTAGT